MEFPDLGSQCSDATCNRLDFLPLKCDACSKLFCKDHISYNSHKCPLAYKKDIQVPVCPLCNVPVVTRRGEPPDIVVGEHIDSDCQSHTAKNRRKVFLNRCSAKGCKQKEAVPVRCGECGLNFCIKHRHTADHNCEGADAARRRRALEAALARQNGPSSSSVSSRPTNPDHMTTMSEDEALARAIALSLEEAERSSQSARTLPNHSKCAVS